MNELVHNISFPKSQCYQHSRQFKERFYLEDSVFIIFRLLSKVRISEVKVIEPDSKPSYKS
jgi:hypothetical protein